MNNKGGKTRVTVEPDTIQLIADESRRRNGEDEVGRDQIRKGKVTY